MTDDIRWHIYIVECSDGTYYTGITTDVERRVREHNGTARAAAYTRSRRPVTLRWADGPYDRSKALRIEREIKQGGRRGKEQMIRSTDVCL